MKKVFTLLVAMTMIIGFAGMAAAQDMCADCGDPGYIDRGCDIPAQGGSVPLVFDYNDTDPGEHQPYPSYCGAKGDVHRAMLDICECDAEWISYNLQEVLDSELTIDITMEILVDGESGDNGVYWAENVGSLYMYTDDCDEADMCATDYLPFQPLHLDAAKLRVPYDFSATDAVDFMGSSQSFSGPFVFEGEDDDTTTPDTTNKTTIMRPDPNAPIGTTGYPLWLNPDDITQGKCVWGIDIPAMWVDYSEVVEGQVVTLKISLSATNSQGLCHKDDCECEILIGTLCCPEAAVSGMGKTLTFPYMPRLFGYYEAQGIALTNLDSEEGEATATLYESDGDVFVATLTVPANNSFNITTAVMATMELQAGSTGNGVLGTVSGGYYFVIETDFNASGLAYFANADNGESLGYLPVTK